MYVDSATDKEWARCMCVSSRHPRSRMYSPSPRTSVLITLLADVRGDLTDERHVFFATRGGVAWSVAAGALQIPVGKVCTVTLLPSGVLNICGHERRALHPPDIQIVPPTPPPHRSRSSRAVPPSRIFAVIHCKWHSQYPSIRIIICIGSLLRNQNSYIHHILVILRHTIFIIWSAKNEIPRIKIYVHQFCIRFNGIRLAPTEQ